MNEFEKSDNLGRNQFCKDFNKYYHIKETDQYAHTDLSLTACSTQKTYSVEIKVRTYCVEELTGSTMIEKTKVDYFKQLNRENCNQCLLYHNYDPRSSWISFDMSGRINYNCDLDKVYCKELPRTSVGDQQSRYKEIYYLHFQQNMYINDRICVCGNS